MSDFYKYFKENMDGLGLPAPENLFASLQAAVGSASVMISACSAAFYVGAVVGSIAVASGRSMADSVSLSDVLATVNKYHFSRPWLSDVLRRWPGIYKPDFASRDTYYRCARLA